MVDFDGLLKELVNLGPAWIGNGWEGRGEWVGECEVVTAKEKRPKDKSLE